MPHGVIVTSRDDIYYINSYTFELLSTNKFRKDVQKPQENRNSEDYLSIKAKLETIAENGFEKNSVTPETCNATAGLRAMTMADYIWDGYNSRGHDIARFSYNDGLEKKIIDVTWTTIDQGDEKLNVFCLKDWTQIEEIEQQKMSQKMERVMVSTITHELRTPMHGILGMFEQIESLAQNPQVLHYCKIGMNTGKLLLNIVNDILDFSQIEVSKLNLHCTQFDPAEVIHECIELFEIQVSHKDIDLKFDSQEEVKIPAIVSDRNRYKQVLLNLISNAIKFTFKGKVKIELRYNEARDYLKTKVRDTGIGISEEEMPKLFKIFGRLENSAKANPQGVGLGLVISQKLTVALGGDIKVKSKTGQGSVFSFYIKNQKQRASLALDGYFQNISHPSKNRRMPDPPKELREIVIMERHADSSEREMLNKLELPELPMKIRSACGCARVLLVDDNEMNLIVLQSFLQRIKLPCHTVPLTEFNLN